MGKEAPTTRQNRERGSKHQNKENGQGSTHHQTKMGKVQQAPELGKGARKHPPPDKNMKGAASTRIRKRGKEAPTRKKKEYLGYAGSGTRRKAKSGAAQLQLKEGLNPQPRAGSNQSAARTPDSGR
jgi:hypothetical protein